MNHYDDNWAQWLPATKFVTNNHAFASTRARLFLATSSHNQQMFLSLVEAPLEARDIHTYVEHIAAIHRTCILEITCAQAKQWKHAN